MQLDFPYHFDARERTAETGEAEHIRDLIEQILFTNPGERVNRPEFGAGVRQLVFAPASPEAAAATSFVIQGALQQYLGRRILLERVTAAAGDGMLTLTIAYRLVATGEMEVVTLDVEGGP